MSKQKQMPTKVWQFDGPSTHGRFDAHLRWQAPDGEPDNGHEAFDLAATDSFLFIGYRSRLTSFIPSWGLTITTSSDRACYGYRYRHRPDNDWVQFRALDDEVVDVDGIPWNAAQSTAATLFDIDSQTIGGGCLLGAH